MLLNHNLHNNQAKQTIHRQTQEQMQNLQQVSSNNQMVQLEIKAIIMRTIIMEIAMAMEKQALDQVEVTSDR